PDGVPVAARARAKPAAHHALQGGLGFDPAGRLPGKPFRGPLACGSRGGLCYDSRLGRASFLSSIDLHCHSNHSAGALAPAAVVERAARRGVRMLALTDHDTLSGLEEAHAAARLHDVRLIDGVEVSVTWRGCTVHVLGLGVDPAD